MGANDWPEVRDDKVSAKVDVGQHVGDDRQVRSITVDNGDPLERSSSANLVDQVLERPTTGALLGLFFNHTISQFQDGLNRQHRTEKSLGATNSASFDQVVQGVEHAEYVRARDCTFNRFSNGVEICTGLGQVCRHKHNEALGHGHGL